MAVEKTLVLTEEKAFVLKEALLAYVEEGYTSRDDEEVRQLLQELDKT
jgi:hypothetical protein